MLQQQMVLAVVPENPDGLEGMAMHESHFSPW